MGADIGLFGLFFLPENTALITKLTQIICCLHLFFFVVTKTRHNISKGRGIGDFGGDFLGFVEFLGHIILLMSEKRAAMQSSQNWKDLVIYQKLLFRFVFLET